jgi:hypothetical protein
MKSTQTRSLKFSRTSGPLLLKALFLTSSKIASNSETYFTPQQGRSTSFRQIFKQFRYGPFPKLSKLCKTSLHALITTSESSKYSQRLLWTWTDSWQNKPHTLGLNNVRWALKHY